jgi:hypothetical protein
MGDNLIIELISKIEELESKKWIILILL